MRFEVNYDVYYPSSRPISISYRYINKRRKDKGNSNRCSALIRL